MLLSNIAILDQSLPTVENLVVNQKALHEFMLQKCNTQTMSFTKRFKLRGNSPQINKLGQELTILVNQGGENSKRILRLENQIQLIVDEDLTQAL